MVGGLKDDGGEFVGGVDCGGAAGVLEDGGGGRLYG
jgi:hypothetical protein